MSRLAKLTRRLLDCSGVVDASIYGVTIAGADGRAGMAAIVVDDGFDFDEFQDHISRRLPAYACPVFLRFCAALDTTETFKQKKQQLVREGFDPRLVTDPLFFRDPKSGAYRPIDPATYARILDGSIPVRRVRIQLDDERETMPVPRFHQTSCIAGIGSNARDDLEVATMKGIQRCDTRD